MLKPYLGLKKSELDTPCLVIDKKILENNLTVMQNHAIANSINLRPHAKTHKCSEMAKLQLKYGAIGICVAKISEACVLVDKGISSVLVTSPIVTKNKILNLLECLKKAPDMMVVVDNEQNLIDLNRAADSINASINVLVDVNPGIGRTGVNFDKALEFALNIENFKRLNLVGVQCYAGNLQHIQSYQDRQKASLSIMNQASALVQTLKNHGLHCPILTGSGTGTYNIDIAASELTEMQPGSYAVMDVEYSIIESTNNQTLANAFKPAMTLLTTVISSNQPEHVTVDAGTKAIYFDIHNKPQIISHPGLQYDWGGFGDEHGKITSHGTLPKTGELIEMIVPHCDPTINLYDKYFVMEEGVVVDVWDIDLRGKTQ